MMYICKKNVFGYLILIDTTNKRHSITYPNLDLLSTLKAKQAFYASNRYTVKNGKMIDKYFVTVVNGTTKYKQITKAEYEIIYSFSSVEEFQNKYPELFL